MSERIRGSYDDALYKSSYTLPAVMPVAKYCDEYVCVCVSVCLSARISPEPHVRSLAIFVHAAYGLGSVLLRRRCDALCISGFVDDIMFLDSGMNFAMKDRYRLNLLVYRNIKGHSLD